MFLGKLFIDPRLIFGDKLACMIYDRFHFAILHFFVLSNVPFPLNSIGRTVDDVSTVAPQCAKMSTVNFVKAYRSELDKVNVGAAPEDPSKRKAFDCITSGEVLGTFFDTDRFIWKLPDKKIDMLVNLIIEASMPGAYLSLKDVEVLHGKLVHFSQLAHPVSFLVGDVVQFLGMLLKSHFSKGSSDRSRASEMYPVPESLRHDLLTLGVIVADTKFNPLPILVDKDMVPGTAAIQVATDVSGHLLGNPSLGLFCPSQLGNTPLVASLSLPRYFLHKVDLEGHVAFHKTTSLECLGYLATLCIDPLRFMDQEIVFTMDNAASVIALYKGRSGDPWATTLVRAARVVAAGIGASLYANWEPRRSTRATRIADDLSHNCLAELSSLEIESYLDRATISFPLPILQWMAKPVHDKTLGRRCLMWLREKYPSLVTLRPSLSREFNNL